MKSNFFLQTQKELDEVVAEKSKVIQEKERLHDDAITTKASLQQKDMHIEELQKEVRNLSKVFFNGATGWPTEKSLSYT